MGKTKKKSHSFILIACALSRRHLVSYLQIMAVSMPSPLRK